jgi:hypothetical protein
MKILTKLLALLITIPLFAQAETFKCKQADGSLSFQDQPCPVGAVSSKVALPKATGESVASDNAVPASNSRRSKIPGAEATPEDRLRESKRRRAEEEINAQNEEIKARNKMQNCNYARRQLGVLKEARPVFTYDNKGERQYIKDESRPAEIAAAERSVAEECN